MAYVELVDRPQVTVADRRVSRRASSKPETPAERRGFCLRPLINEVKQSEPLAATETFPAALRSSLKPPPKAEHEIESIDAGPSALSSCSDSWSCAALLAYAVFRPVRPADSSRARCASSSAWPWRRSAVVVPAGRRCMPRAPGRAGRSTGCWRFVAAGIGAGIAGRHVWLQHLPPDQVPACGPGLSYMVESMPS